MEEKKKSNREREKKTTKQKQIRDWTVLRRNISRETFSYDWIVVRALLFVFVCCVCVDWKVFHIWCGIINQEKKKN